MKKCLAQLALVLVLSAVLASTGHAQRRYRRVSATPRPTFGAHLGYNFDASRTLLGAQLSWPIVPALDLYPSFDVYLGSGSLWALNFDVKYRPPTNYRAWYVGGGLNYTHATGGHSTNLNLLTGLEARRGAVRPYVEAKLIVGDGSAFQLVGGLSWR